MAGERSLYPEERRLEILKRVNREGRVAVAELSQEFKVSEVTIRTDLQALAIQSLIVRTHGGAVPASRVPEASLFIRQQQQVDEKERIGRAAATMVSSGEAIFLDSSSTALAMARFLKGLRDLTVITNSLVVTQLLMNTPGITVVMPGGVLQRDTVSLTGPEGLLFLRKFNIQSGFFGAHGLSCPEGLTDVCISEAEVKQGVIAMCRQAIAILDATKWGRVGLASFARLEQLSCVITDVNAPGAIVDKVRALGIQVVQV